MSTLAVHRSSRGSGSRNSTWALALVGVLSVVGLSILILPSKSVGSEVKVVRILDGDTVVVRYKAQDRKIRLLNVDTPETRNPTAKGQCLAPQATSELRRLLPAGKTVRIKFDGEHRDRYGRDLAAIYLTDGRMVNAEIARAGLGNPVQSDDSSEYYSDIKAAQVEAYAKKRGFFDPNEKCTVAGRIQAIEARLHKAASAKPKTVAEAKVIQAELADAIADAKAFDKLIKNAPDEDSSWLAYSGDRMTVLSSSVSLLIEDGMDTVAVVQATEDQLATTDDGTSTTTADGGSTSGGGTTSSGGTTSTSKGGSKLHQCTTPGEKHSKPC